MCNHKSHEDEPLFSSISISLTTKEKGREYREKTEDAAAWPSPREVVEELRSLGGIAGPMVMTSLLLYSRSVISMLFLGHLGETELAGASLSMGFANITGYSVISGLALGMEPICGQAYGAKRCSLLSLALQRTFLLLLIATIPISILWLNMEPILLWLGQDHTITGIASTFIAFSLPDLLAQAFLQPLRIFLRTQNLIKPLIHGATFALILHIPTNYFLVIYLKLGIRGVALAASSGSFNMVFYLLAYLAFTKSALKPWENLTRECLQGWKPLLYLSLPSAASVCLEWWWYELMIILCGLLSNPRASVASMGILIQTTALIYVFPSSISLAVSTRVGHELGANQPDKARRATVVAMVSGAMMGFLALLFTLSMSHFWAKMFTNDAEILLLTSITLPIVGLCELGNCPQTTGCGVLRGSARPSIGANINLGSFYLIGMPVSILMGFGFKLGFVGLWLGLAAAQGSCVALMLYTVFNTDWKCQAKRAKLLIAEDGVANDLEATLLVH
ncbi:protein DETOXIFICATION 48 [Amborella trichopoda]|uniref:Protein DETOXIFICATION n=1 Tax=Amborella trichopoda TaxID=13333 RepID=W1PAR6_AMBTC|nr:protein DETOXIFICATION 48 [Amborella trichopoda]ERN04120.1 hypothetical protein AMTR_s00077p00047440 [Amborella trichopoda]|eukprot:XP_011622720.2 protein DETOXIFICATION 48 [Amborella trichopoda]